jgi:predicted ribosome quality control (RQC) complex YloA/Tae2 family protein
MCNIEYSFLLRELGPLVGKHLNKLYDWGEGKLRFKFGNADIACKLGAWLALTNYIEETPSSPTDFAMQLRNRIENTKLVSISQPNSDRLLQFEFSDGHLLVFEMFAKGNLVLVNDGKCILCYRREEWKDRKIAPSSPYQYPKPPQITEPLPSFGQFRSLFDSRYSISCANQLPIGLLYIKEALIRAKIPEQKQGSGLTDSELRLLYETLASMLATLSPLSYYGADGKQADYSLTLLSQHSLLQAKPSALLSEAVSSFALAHPVQDSKLEEKIKQLERRLSSQQEALLALEKEELKAREAGERIKGRQHELDEFLQKLRAHSKLSESELELLLAQFEGKFDKKKGKAQVTLD